MNCTREPNLSRNSNIDLLKGFLIILVIIGHIACGSLDENLLRNFIYSFHMPLFIGISGYLFNVQKIIDSRPIVIFNEYTRRIIIPWLLAVVVYGIITNLNQMGGVIDFLMHLLKSIIFPYYHLWYIPSYLLWVLATCALIKSNISVKYIFYLSVIISCSMYICQTIFKYVGLTNVLNELFKVRAFTYFAFWGLGLYIRHIQTRIIQKNINFLIFILPILGVIVSIANFYIKSPIINNCNIFIFNFSLLYLLLVLSIHRKLPHIKLLEWMGVNSLGIYLWHVIPILAGKYLLRNSIGSANYYLLTTTLTICFIIVYKCSCRLKFFRVYLYGLKH